MNLKSLFLLFTILVQRNSFAAPITIEVKVNEVNALLQFLLGYERNGETFSQYKYVFGNTADSNTKAMLATWSELSHNNMLKFDGYPESRYNGKSVSNLVFIQSVNARTINELVQNCAGFYTQTELKKFADVLNYFYPFYHKKIWLPNEKRIKEDAKKLNVYIKSKGVDNYFSRAANFYGVEWNSRLPFYVMINPLVGKVEYTTARPMGNVLIADYILGDKDYNGWLGVVVHEMCHVLFSNQTREKQYATEHYFLKSNEKKYALAAYNWFDETIATAIGNGYVVEKINGKKDENEWYHNSYINKNAKAVYALVKSYLDSAKTMDGDFIYAYINLFKETFPIINREADHLFSFVDIASDTVTNNMYRDLYAYFQPRWVGWESSVDDCTLDKTSKLAHTKIIIITKDHANRIKAVNEAMQISVGDTSDYLNKIYYECKPDGNNCFVFHLSGIDKLDAAMKKLSEVKILPEEKGILLVE